MAITTAAKADVLMNLHSDLASLKSLIKNTSAILSGQSLWAVAQTATSISAQLKSLRDRIAGALVADPTLVVDAEKADLVALRDLVNRIVPTLDSGAASLAASVAAALAPLAAPTSAALAALATKINAELSLLD